MKTRLGIPGFLISDSGYYREGHDAVAALRKYRYGSRNLEALIQAKKGISG